MPESTRRQIGKYQIQAELGRGGFGVVYSAHDPTVGRPVAVKVLTAIGDSQLLTRFKNEAAAAGNLRHKNIVTIYDYGDDDGLPYIVMELLEGEDLNQIIASRKPMPLLQKVSIMVQVADGLRCAHRAGVVHRDVKPGNIRLLPDGTVKLMDFGIARLVAGSAGTRLTRQGHVIGTLYYMAPEQVLGEDVDALSDIFAYGSTYYELLTGKHPFQGLDPRSVFHKITAEDPEPIRNLVPDCPEALEKIVNRTLQKDRDLRYQSLRDVQVDTEPILIDLRQERATSLVREAKRLYGAADLESAQAVLGEVFDLDPVNRDARQLRETIQSQLLNRLIRPKVEALVKKADDALSTRHFEEAIESFEAAFRLDRENQTVSEKLDEARRLLALRREMSGLIADARRHFAKDSLDEALEILLQVLEKDPADPEAQQWLKEVRAALNRRERERDYQVKLQHANDLLQANDFDEAAKILADLDPECKGREEVGLLAGQIRSAKELYERQRLVSQEIASVRELLNGTQFEAAIKRLELLMKRFPEEVEPSKLYILAYKEWNAYRRAQAVSKLETELNRLTASAHFERALSLIKQSLNTYPAEPRLLAAQRQIEEDWARHKRETAIRKLLEDAERHGARNELDRAVEVLEGGLRQYPDEPRLGEWLASAREALARKRREEAIEKVCAQARAQLNERQYGRALEAIERTQADYGTDARLTAIRDKVATAKAEWERAEAIRELVEKSQQLVARNDFEAALELLHGGLQQFPGETQLAKSLATAKDALAAKQRDQGIEAACSDARAHLNERQFQKAQQSVDRGFTEYGSDRRLETMREQIASAKAAWERGEAIRQALDDSRGLIERQDFEGGIALLESALKRYSGEQKLVEALHSARKALAAKRRDEAIGEACVQAQSQADSRDFQTALKTIDRSLTDHGGDVRLRGLRDRVLAAKAEWERVEAIRLAAETAERFLGEGRPERALESLTAALSRYANEPKLLEVKVGAEQALAAKRREQAIEDLGRQANAKLQAGEHDNALSILDRGLQEFGGDRRLSDLRTTVASAKAAWQREQAIARLAEDSRKLMANREFEKAVALLGSGLNEFPGEQRLTQNLEVARTELAAQQRNQAIASACKLAQVQLEKGDYARALEIVDGASDRYGGDERLVAMRDTSLAAKAAWERAEAIRGTVAEARSAVGRQEFDRAISLLESAGKRYGAGPLLAEALSAAVKARDAKRRDDAIEALIKQAETETDQREFSRALKTIEAGVKNFGTDARLAAMREKSLTAKAAWERAEAIRRALESAQALLAQEKPGAAVKSLEEALRRYPGDAQITDGLERARKTLASFEREQAITALLAQAQQLWEGRKFATGVEALDRGLQQHGQDSRLSDLRARVLAGKADWERAESLRQLVKSARERIAQGQPESAAELLEAARSQFEGEAQFIEAMAAASDAIVAKKKEHAIQAACQTAQRLLDERNFEPALQTLDEAAHAQGPDSRISTLRERIAAAKAAWERSEAIRAVLENARRRLDEKDAYGALEILNEALGSYSGDPEILKIQAEAQEAVAIAQKETALAALSRQTRLFIGTQDFPTALAMVDEGLKNFGPETRLADLRENVLAAQAEWERMDALRKAVSEANHLLAQRMPEKACRFTEDALARFPGDPLLLEVLGSARDALALKRREESVERISREARGLLENGKFDAALQQVEQGLRELPDDRRLTELRDTVATAKAQAQRVADEIRSVIQSAKTLSERGQREEAIALLERSLAEHPANPELVAAIVGTIDSVGAAGTVAIDDICRDARQYMLTGNFDLAFLTLERALQLQSEEEEAAVEEASQKTRSETVKPVRSGSTLMKDAGTAASVKEETAEHALSGGGGGGPVEIPITDEHAVGATAVFDPNFVDRIVAPPPARGEPASRERGRKNLWPIAVAAIPLIVFAAVLILRTRQFATLQVRSSPPDATIYVNGSRCATSNCEFRGKPGYYQIRASAPGYREETANVMFRRGETPVITLKPLDPTARISANFGDGDVLLDNGKAARMQDGQFVLDRLSPGSHKLRVSGREGTASVSFTADYAKLPVITDISPQNTGVIAAANFGDRAAVACPGCTGTVSMDERQIGEMKNGSITIDNVTPGTHRVKVGDQHSLIFTAANSPAIDLAVNSNRNVGALVIETGVDGATVFVDGKKYPRPTTQGQLLIPAEAREHVIRVTKDGYRANPPEIRAQLTKGEQFQARFDLAPEPGRLSVSRYLPGTAVYIDGARAGTIGADGGFSTPVGPGNHRLEFRKDGYVTAQVQRSFDPGKRVLVSGTDTPLVAQSSPAAPPPVAAPPPKPDPNAVEQADWQRVAGSPTISQLEDFLKAHPAGIHHDEAELLLKELRQQRADAAREAAWNGLDKSSRTSLEEFLSQYGEGAHSQDARGLIAGMEKTERDRLAAQQRAKEQANRTSTDATIILNTLSEFQTAYNQMSLPTLQGLWNGMPKNIVESYRNQFRDAKSLDFRLAPTGAPVISGNTATVICIRTLKFVAKNGQRPPETSERVRVSLERAGSQWTIRTIAPF